MIDHISLPVENFSESIAFYDQTLKVIGCERLLTFQDKPENGMAGYGKEGKASFWITSNNNGQPLVNMPNVEVTFKAMSADQVDQWHALCLKAGAQDVTAPAHYPDYHPGYYGACVIDPSGWRIEMVIHDYQK